ncbi:MAG: calcium/sodium antiporter [Paludibacteraceae bacterium]
MLWLNIVLLIVGFVVLILGADWLVNGASGLAKRLNVPDLVIGLTVVAFGTSAPELVVNIMAAIEGSSEIALTNILGSNIINVLVILGLSAAICPIASQRSARRFDIPLSVLAGVAVLIFGTECFGWCGDGSAPQISRLDGVLLLVVFAMFMGHSVVMARRGDNQSESFSPMPVWKALMLMVVGIGGLVLGGELIVRNAVAMAAAWGVSQAVIGVTIVALGTSLPELAMSAVAAVRKNTDLAIGNVIGSNIFNVFFVLGTSAVIRPLPSYPHLIVDASVAAGCCALVWLFVGIGKQHRVERWQGGVLLLCYAVYLTWLLLTI